MTRTKQSHTCQLLLVLVLSLLCSITAMADTVALTFVSAHCDYEDVGAGDSEGPDKLFDNTMDTKWCSYGRFPDADVYVIFKASRQMALDEYSIGTAADANWYTERNPESWAIYGSNDQETWELLDSIASDTKIKAACSTRYYYTPSVSSSKSYLYFKFVLTAIESNSTSGYFQFSELSLTSKSCTAALHYGDVIQHTPQEATCTEYGYSQTCYECPSCGKFYSDAARTHHLSIDPRIAMLGHDYDAEGKCTRCGVENPYFNLFSVQGVSVELTNSSSTPWVAALPGDTIIGTACVSSSTGWPATDEDEDQTWLSDAACYEQFGHYLDKDPDHYLYSYMCEPKFVEYNMLRSNTVSDGSCERSEITLTFSSASNFELSFKYGKSSDWSDHMVLYMDGETFFNDEEYWNYGIDDNNSYERTYSATLPAGTYKLRAVYSRGGGSSNIRCGWLGDFTAIAECMHNGYTQTLVQADYKAATCGTMATDLYRCEHCGQEYEVEKGECDLSKHGTLTYHAKNGTSSAFATCTRGYYKSNCYVCELCGRYFKDSKGTTELTTIPFVSPKGHNYVSNVCTNKNYHWNSTTRKKTQVVCGALADSCITVIDFNGVTGGRPEIRLEETQHEMTDFRLPNYRTTNTEEDKTVYSTSKVMKFENEDGSFLTDEDGNELVFPDSAMVAFTPKGSKNVTAYSITSATPFLLEFTCSENITATLDDEDPYNWTYSYIDQNYSVKQYSTNVPFEAGSHVLKFACDNTSSYGSDAIDYVCGIHVCNHPDKDFLRVDTLSAVATCVTPDTLTRHCQHCGYDRTDVGTTLDAINHKTTLVAVGTSEASCSQGGVSTSYYYCPACQHNYRDLAGAEELGSVPVIEAAGHKKGTDGKCTVCGQTLDCYDGTPVMPTCITLANYATFGLDVTYVGYYAVTTPSELYGFKELVVGASGSDREQNMVLLNDLVINKDVLDEDYALNGTPTYEWEGLGWLVQEGYGYASYTGTVDGRGHTISGLYRNYTSNSNNSNVVVGFICFGSDGTTIRDLNIKDSYFAITGANGNYAGTFLGYGNVNMYNCYADAAVSATYSGTISSSNSYHSAGILCGSASSSVLQNCFATGSVTASNYAGGLAGYLSNSSSWLSHRDSVINCYSYPVQLSGKYTGAVAGDYVGDTSFSLPGFFNVGYSRKKVVGGVQFGNSSSFVSVEGKLREWDPTTGEATYYLSQGSTANGTFYSGDVWRQTLATDTHPVLDSNSLKVYYGSNSCVTTTYGYTNSVSYGIGHEYDDNGICVKTAGEIHYQAAEQAEDGFYEITNYGQLCYFADLVNSGKSNINARLMNDITASKNAPWINIGCREQLIWDGQDYDYPFCGEFDGQNHEVRGLYYYRPLDETYEKSIVHTEDDGTVVVDTVINVYYYRANRSHVGLIGYMTGGLVHNVGVVDFDLTGAYYVAPIVGKMEGGTVQNCFASSGKIRGSQYTGGLVGGDQHNESGEVWNGNEYMSRQTEEFCAGYLHGCYTAGTQITTLQDGPVTIEPVRLYSNDGEAHNYQAFYFDDGSACYLLNGGQTDENTQWRQTLGEDPYPVLNRNHKIVYYGYNNCYGTGDLAYYNVNVPANADSYPVHNFEDGFCVLCGALEPCVHNTKDGYYEAGNAGQLMWFADHVNSAYDQSSTVANCGDNLRIVNDITLNKNLTTRTGIIDNIPTHEWVPIGKVGSVFHGSIDGQHHTISGLYTYQTGDEGEVAETDTVADDENSLNTGLKMGLVGYAKGYTVEYEVVDGKAVPKDTLFNSYRNLDIRDCYFRGNGYVGGLAGHVVGKITVDSVTVQNSLINEGDYTGGLLGYCDDRSTISNCTNDSSVITSGYGMYVGGIVGKATKQCLLTNLVNTGSITACGQMIGGIAGQLTNACKMIYCCNKGAIVQSSSNENYQGYVGGLAGQLLDNAGNAGTGSSIYYSSNQGSIESKSNYVGGLVSLLTATNASSGCHLERSYNSGALTGNTFVGNLYAQITSSPVNHCCVMADNISAVKTVSQLSSIPVYSSDAMYGGEAAYYMNENDNNQAVPVWRQTIVNGQLPNFAGQMVHYAEYRNYYYNGRPIGDMDEDEKVTPDDISTMADILASNKASEIDLDVIDVNGDGVFTLKDIILLINSIKK